MSLSYFTSEPRGPRPDVFYGGPVSSVLQSQLQFGDDKSLGALRLHCSKNDYHLNDWAHELARIYQGEYATALQTRGITADEVDLTNKSHLDMFREAGLASIEKAQRSVLPEGFVETKHYANANNWDDEAISDILNTIMQEAPFYFWLRRCNGLESRSLEGPAAWPKEFDSLNTLEQQAYLDASGSEVSDDTWLGLSGIRAAKLPEFYKTLTEQSLPYDLHLRLVCLRSSAGKMASILSSVYGLLAAQINGYIVWNGEQDGETLVRTKLEELHDQPDFESVKQALTRVSFDSSPFVTQGTKQKEVRGDR